MSTSKEKKPKLNVSERYKKYVCEWFGVEIDPESSEVVIPQWKFYRITGMNKQLREASYFSTCIILLLVIMMMWYAIQ